MDNVLSILAPLWTQVKLIPFLLSTVPHFHIFPSCLLALGSVTYFLSSTVIILTPLQAFLTLRERENAMENELKWFMFIGNKYGRMLNLETCMEKSRMHWRLSMANCCWMNTSIQYFDDGLVNSYHIWHPLFLHLNALLSYHTKCSNFVSISSHNFCYDLDRWSMRCIW